MDAFFHNALADMYGPNFLVLYALVILAVLAVCLWQARSTDHSGYLPPPIIPAEIDPFELAYLRGGEEEVLRLATLSLLQRGYLERQQSQAAAPSSKEELIQHAKHPPDARHLSDIERIVFRWFAESRTGSEIFRAETVKPDLSHACTHYETRLRQEDFLIPSELRDRTRKWPWIGGSIILALGCYKLTVALHNGHYNVLFLVLMAAISIVVLTFLCRAPRLSKRGQVYLDRVRLALDKLRNKADSLAAGADPMLLLLVSAFGIEVLSATTYSFYPRMLRRAAHSPGGPSDSGSSCSSCSSSGGSSCGGGGGCGGGCGGCGS